MKQIFIAILLIFLFHRLSGQEKPASTKKEFNSLPIAETTNFIPDSNYFTIYKDTVIEGKILSICNGYSIIHPYPITSAGVLKISCGTKRFSILLAHDNFISEKEGDSIKITISPLTKKDLYFKPLLMTCEGIGMKVETNILCVIKTKLELTNDKLLLKRQ